MSDPFALAVDFASGALTPATSRTERRVSHLRAHFADREAAAELVGQGDPLVYEVMQYDVAEVPGELVCCTTVIQPGVVGDEYYMTKGHYHAKRQTGEVYLGLSGAGHLLLTNEHGDFRELPMGTGTIGYVAPGWAHRTVNVGDEPFSFLAVYLADSGHDYETIEQTGFPRRMVKTADGPSLR